ncbi:MAG: hypothetical protein Q4C96_05175 [Planctomycetia bacterium]|nr:hypothetical protein [Planctomycetia bacterium]
MHYQFSVSLPANRQTGKQSDSTTDIKHAESILKTALRGQKPLSANILKQNNCPEYTQTPI